MAKLLNKLYVRIIISAAIGFFLVGAWTNIQYPCPPLDNAGCVVWESAIMHPLDLINNKQDSLKNFVTNFVIISLASLALLSVFSHSQRRKNA
jgi:hypothetical protein